MGELILCRHTIAAMPFYFENVSLNVYSMEEICYYIEKNLYLINEEFMSGELCAWLDQELKETVLANQLNQVIQRNGTLLEFVQLILQSTYYCSRESIQHILSSLEELQNKSAFECGKIRADRLFLSGKYLIAAREYRKLLQFKEEEKKDALLFGNIWHNLGVVYARTFLFQEAARCFLNGYQISHNPETLKECFFSYHCIKDTQGMEQTARLYGLSSEEQKKLLTEFHEIETACMEQTEVEMEALFEAEAEELKSDSKAFVVVKQLEKEYKNNYKM